jgi:hypothetical protein
MIEIMKREKEMKGVRRMRKNWGVGEVRGWEAKGSQRISKAKKKIKDKKGEGKQIKVIR